MRAYRCPRCHQQWSVGEATPPHLCRDLRAARRAHVLALIFAALAAYGLSVVAQPLSLLIYDRLVRGGEEWDK